MGLLGIFGKKQFKWVERLMDNGGRAMCFQIQTYQLTVLLVVMHIIFLVLFGVFIRFDERFAMPNEKGYNTYSDTKYPNFADTHMMIFVGFGFIMTFLKRYGFSSVAMNMLLACVSVEWGLLCRGFMSEHFAKTGTITLNIEQMLQADFAAANNLISLGVMLGKLSPIQYVIMVLIETPAMVAVENLVRQVLFINDVGDAIVVHVFGCYFGLACSLLFAKKVQRDHRNEGGLYHTQIFAVIGALFLWVWWPSFNAGTAEPADAHHRAIINTLLSLTGSAIGTFLTSQLFEPHKKFNMVHITNSTLAGGVAIGACANVVLDPILSLGVGTLSGMLSTLGYIYVTPYFTTRFRIHDTCGAHNIHGIPGILAGLFAAVIAVAYPKERFGSSIAKVYPAIAAGRTEGTQALMQLAGLGTVMGCSILAGAFTGLVLRLPFLNQVRDEGLYADEDYFDTPEDYEFTTRLSGTMFKQVDQDEEKKDETKNDTKEVKISIE